MENVFRILAIALVVFYMFCINVIKADTTVKLNYPSKSTNSGKPSVKFPFISDEINSQFKELPKQHKNYGPSPIGSEREPSGQHEYEMVPTRSILSWHLSGDTP